MYSSIYRARCLVFTRVYICTGIANEQITNELQRVVPVLNDAEEHKYNLYRIPATSLRGASHALNCGICCQLFVLSIF